MSSTLTPNATERADLASIVWSAIGKVASKEHSRDELQPGSQHVVQLDVSGTVDGRAFQRNLNAVLSVGHDQVKATSVTPEQPQLLAVILSKLNQQTRDKILRELPDEFAENGGHLPDVEEELVDTVSTMLQSLRAKKRVQARGPVRCEYQLTVDDLTAVA